MTRRWSGSLRGVSAFLLAGALFTGAAVTAFAQAAQAFNVQLRNFTIAGAPAQVRAGAPITFNATAMGLPHNLAIEGSGVDLHPGPGPNLTDGQSGTITFAALQPGTYTLYCPVGMHRANGMQTTLTVVAATQPARHRRRGRERRPGGAGPGGAGQRRRRALPAPARGVTPRLNSPLRAPASGIDAGARPVSVEWAPNRRASRVRIAAEPAAAPDRPQRTRRETRRATGRHAAERELRDAAGQGDGRGAAPAPATGGGRDLGGSGACSRRAARGRRRAPGRPRPGNPAAREPCRRRRVGWDTFRGFTPATEWPRMMAESFQAKHPNVKIDARAIALDAGNQQSAYPKMLAMLQAGTLGEVHAWDPSHWQLYQAVKRNIIRPIDELVARDKFDLKQYYAPFIEYQKWQGKLWGLPSWGWTGQRRHPLQHRAGPAGGGHLPGPELPRLDDEQALRERREDGEVRRAGGGLRPAHHPPRHGRGDRHDPRLQRGQPQPGRQEVHPDGRGPQGGHEAGSTTWPTGRRWSPSRAPTRATPSSPGRWGSTTRAPSPSSTSTAPTPTACSSSRPSSSPSGGTASAPRSSGAAPGTSSARATSYPDHAWEFIKHITSREGALLFNTDGGNQAQVRPDIMDDKYFQDPNFKVYLENFENAMVHVVPANLRGTEFEPAYNEKGPIWYKGASRLRGRPEAVERRGAARPRPA